MKKLLLVLTILSVVLLGACASSDSTNELEDRIDVLELQVAEIEQILIDIEIIEGLNNQKEFYLPTNNETMYTPVNASEIELLGTELDKTKAPTYVLDIDDNYIDFDSVAQLLVSKYFGETVSVLDASIGSLATIILSNGEYTQDEFMARLILLVGELSNYDFYIIGSSELVIQTDFGGTTYIRIPMQTLRSTFITITPEVIYNGLYEIELFNFTYSNVLVQEFYDTYILDELFNGYVLDYKG